MNNKHTKLYIGYVIIKFDDTTHSEELVQIFTADILDTIYKTYCINKFIKISKHTTSNTITYSKLDKLIELDNGYLFGYIN